MHQDQRIGLALGVLLIGACAAFFFRNETHDAPRTLRLQHAQELDERIAERSTRPYLKGIEVIEAADQARMKTISDRTEHPESDDDHVSSFFSPIESFGKRARKSNPSGPGANLQDLDGDIEELEPIRVPTYGLGTSDQSGSSIAGQGPSTSAAPHRTHEMSKEGSRHIVQKGETLSSIAARTLGNANRFPEIFEANQDQLKDANDLRPGMSLIIPDGRVATGKNSTTGNSAFAATDSPSAHSLAAGPSTVTNHLPSEPLEQQARLPVPTDNSAQSAPSGESQGATAAKSKRFVPARHFPYPIKP